MSDEARTSGTVSWLNARSVWTWGSIAVPGALLLACAWFAGTALHESRAAASALVRARDGLDQLSRLRTALLDAAQTFRVGAPEAAAQQDPDEAVEQVRRILGHLQPNEEDGPPMTSDLGHLREAVGAYLAMLDYRRIAFLAHDDAALSEMLEREPLTLQPALSALEDIETRERWAADRWETDLADASDELRGSLALTAFFAVLLQIWIWLVIRHDRRHRARVERTLRATNEELEARVAERTSTLAAANRTLAALSSRLLQVQEQERRSLALELHDQIGQQLAALLMNLRVLESATTQKSAVGDELLRDCTEIVQTTYEQIHDLALDLRPSLLDRAGLVPTIEWYARHQQARTNCPISVTAAALPHPLASEVSNAAFRIVQEAVNNALKHGTPRTIDIAVRRQDSSFELVVRDDGKGFDVSSAPDHGECGLGLLGMRERAALAGGTLTIASQVGKGTEVTARLPLVEREVPSEEAASAAR